MNLKEIFLRQRVDIRLVNNEKVAKKFSAKPNFKHCTILDENFIAIHMKKKCLISPFTLVCVSLI